MDQVQNRIENESHILYCKTQIIVLQLIYYHNMAW